jgi:ribosomal protein S18 acetylase RimI-like enzyme
LNDALVIRPAVEADLESMADWTARVPLFAEHGITAAGVVRQLRAALEDPGASLLVAERGGVPVGFAHFLLKGGFGRSGYLKLLSVDERVRSQGVGRALMAELELRFLAPNGLFLLCTHTNLGARRFYEGLGYTQVGEVPDYLTPGLQEVIYFKPAPMV